MYHPRERGGAAANGFEVHDSDALTKARSLIETLNSYEAVGREVAAAVERNKDGVRLALLH